MQVEFRAQQHTAELIAKWSDHGYLQRSRAMLCGEGWTINRNPLQHKPVVREQPISAGGALERERADPGVELLGRQFLTERVEAALPENRDSGHR